MDKIFRLHSYYFPPEITNKILFEHKGLCHPTAKIIKEEVNIFKQNILNIWSDKIFDHVENKSVNEGINNFFDGEQNYYNISSYVFNLKTKNFYYTIAPKNLKVGDIVKSGSNAEIKNGHSLPISKIPVGCLIHNIAPKINGIAKFSRSAGTFSQLIEKTTNYGKIKLSSGEQQTISINCFATIGIVSNEFLTLTTLGKAGRSRWLNKRPKVRGVAMNPIDHPHGGGEGKTSGGRSSVTPWGKPTKNGKTSKSKNKFRILIN